MEICLQEEIIGVGYPLILFVLFFTFLDVRSGVVYCARTHVTIFPDLELMLRLSSMRVEREIERER